MTTSPRDRAAAVAEKVIGEHRFWYQDIGPIHYICWCDKPHSSFCEREGHNAHLAAALADALVAEGLVGDGETRQ